MNKKAKRRAKVDPEQVLRDVRVTLAWYTAWLIANGPALKEGTDCYAVVDKFFKEDEEMVRRFFWIELEAGA